MSSVTCEASSRVGTRTSAEGRGSLVVVRSTIGTANASVLPEPVGDLVSTSRPARASGRTSSWIRNGWWIERAASASTTGRDAPSSRKDCCDMCCSTPYGLDRKSTRLNSSHVEISYAVFCLKKKKKKNINKKDK